MPEAVIVSTARSPIGRANKGSLTQVRPDDLAATIIRAALDKVPSLDASLVEDIILGCAQQLPQAVVAVLQVEGSGGSVVVVAAAASLIIPPARCSRSVWPPTPSKPARVTSSSPPASRP